MAVTMSADEVRQQYEERFGTDRDRSRFMFTLRSELITLHLKWRQFVLLFAAGPERVAILNETAPFFFGIAQGVLWEDILLHIARLCDHPGERERSRFTIRRLPTVFSEISTLQAAVDTAESTCAFVRHPRNNHIGHLNLDAALNADPVSMGNREQVEGALAALRAVFHAVELPILDSTTAFEFAGTHRDADSLLFYLQAGRNATAR